MIAIIDYKVGNLKSVSKALDNLGLKNFITNNTDEINNSKAIILPGVGAFNDAMEQLKKEKLIGCIKNFAAKGKPILGICLGMQVLYEKSFEDGEWEGLGLLKGEIVRINNNLKVPHMGWNKLIPGVKDDIGKDLGDDSYVYFVHSYYLRPQRKEEVVFWTEYGIMVPAVVRENNIMGMQFHPEKSGKAGMKLLENFGRMIP